MKKSSVLQATSPLIMWLSYLEKLHIKSIDMETSRVNQVAMRLNILKPAPFIFTVAGTNGKGTTCRMLEMILIETGYRVGVYNSPHLMRYTERIRVQNTELSELAHTTSFAEIEAVREDIPLTYFEYSTLSALWLFKKAQLDVVILEIGLGGRLDAGNIIDSDVAVITSIALDHTDWLGSNRESIGREKAGIFRSNKPAVVGELDMPFSIAEVAKEKGAHLLRLGIDWQSTIVDNGWNFIDLQGQLNNLPFPQIPQQNAATALAAVRASGLTINKKAIYDSIQNVTLPGRFQIIDRRPRVILDVAHNPHAINYLAERLAALPRTGRILAIIGMLYDKDIGSSLSFIQNKVDNWYCASLEIPRGASARQLMEYLNQGKIYDNVQQAWKAALIDAKPEDTILVFGSFYTVAYVMNIIEKTDIK